MKIADFCRRVFVANMFLMREKEREREKKKRRERVFVRWVWLEDI